MKSLTKFLPYILAVALFFAGRWTGPEENTELLQQYKSERKYHLDQISDLTAKVSYLDKAGRTLEEKMKSDSLRFSIALKANNEAYLKLKKRYNEINLNRANAHSLDSLVSSLYTN